MARLPDNDAMHGLDGWGSFKKKVGLNKLHTRQAVASVVKVTKAVVAPTKSNVKKAEDAAKPYIAPLLQTAGNILAPGVGSLLAQGWTAARAKAAAKKMHAEAGAAGTLYYDENGAQISKEQYDAIMSLAAVEPAAGAETPAAAAAEAPKSKARSMLVWGVVGTLATGGLLGLIVGGRRRGKAA